MSTTAIKEQILNGSKAFLPLMVGVFPFGMIYGALAIQAGIPRDMAHAMSFVVFAGSAQFVVAQLFQTTTPAIVIILTVYVINLRHALYSASVAPYLTGLSNHWKAGLAYLLTDEAYAVAITHYNEPGDIKYKHWYFLAAGLSLWTCWQVSTALGIFLGAVIPSSWSLDFSLALTFIALTVPILKDRAGVVAALVAGVVAVLCYSLPYKLWLIIASFAGILAGLWSEK
jgi:4-azaleucine resistance transporter AzlC